VRPEAAFLAGYAVALLAIAAGVESLGRRPMHPWASKADWPHSEVPVFHLDLSGVVLAAALLLTAVSVARHHDPIELLVQVALLAIITRRIVRLIGRHRALVAAAVSGEKRCRLLRERPAPPRR
jgi:hypothetical protein